MTDEPSDADDDTSGHGADRDELALDVDPPEPLSELAERARRERASDGDLEDVFDRESVVDVDTEELWAQIEREEPPSVDAIVPEGREIREIDKARYCHRCPHFSRPPAVRCEHEGTNILELTDAETFRVADCPIVLEEEALEGTW